MTSGLSYIDNFSDYELIIRFEVLSDDIAMFIRCGHRDKIKTDEDYQKRIIILDYIRTVILLRMTMDKT